VSAAPIYNLPARPLPYVIDDGGRARAGFKGRAGDCVARSVAIAGQLDYLWVYDLFAAGEAARGEPRSARNGVSPKVYKPILQRWGWAWTPTMSIGSGTRVHLAAGELPAEGRLLVRCSRHLTAVIAGQVHDTHDPCRGGTRAVYGYWTVPENWRPR
jgi:hypothetical protein